MRITIHVTVRPSQGGYKYIQIFVCIENLYLSHPDMYHNLCHLIHWMFKIQPIYFVIKLSIHTSWSYFRDGGYTEWSDSVWTSHHVPFHSHCEGASIAWSRTLLVNCPTRWSRYCWGPFTYKGIIQRIKWTEQNE